MCKPTNIGGCFAPDDVVFLNDEAQRKEYVLNDTGYIYVGSAYSIYDRPWNFGQVKKAVLLAILPLFPFSPLAVHFNELDL